MSENAAQVAARMAKKAHFGPKNTLAPVMLKGWQQN
jgi:hypothetical protein